MLGVWYTICPCLFPVWGGKIWKNIWKTTGNPPQKIHETKGSINGNFQNGQIVGETSEFRRADRVSASYV